MPPPWAAGIRELLHCRRPFSRAVDELTRPGTDRLLRALRRTVHAAVGGGGVDTLTLIPFRRPEAACPRCGTPMAHGTVGGRTTWWCPREQT